MISSKDRSFNIHAFAVPVVNAFYTALEQNDIAAASQMLKTDTNLQTTMTRFIEDDVLQMRYVYSRYTNNAQTMMSMTVRRTKGKGDTVDDLVSLEKGERGWFITAVQETQS